LIFNVKQNMTIRLFAFLLFVPTLLSAQKGTVKQDSSHGYSYSYVEGDPLKARIYKLKNGLTIMMSINRNTPRVYTCIAVKAGSANDPKTNTGLAHYLEHMLFKGTESFGSLNYEKEGRFLAEIDTLYEKYNSTKDEAKRKRIYKDIDSISQVAAKFAIANEYDKMMQHIGAKGTNAFTSFDETVYINDIPSNSVTDWVSIEGERFRNPVLRLFHTELEAVYEEKNISLDSDDNKVYDGIFSALFTRHTYGLQTTIGSVEHLKNPSLPKIREFYENYYVPGNMAIIMAGNFDCEETVALIEKAFGGFEDKPVKQLDFSAEKKMDQPVVKNVFGPEAPSVTIGFRLPSASSKEAELMKITDLLLTNSTAGLFDLNLVKKQQVLEAYTSLFPLKDYSVLFMAGSPKTGQSLEKVKDLMLAQLDSVKQGKFDERLLRAIVFNQRVDDIGGMESNSGRAFKMMNTFVNEIKWSDEVKQADEMERISKDDVIRFANKFFLNDYAVVFKRQGVDSSVVKIDKPQITAVEVNREKTSRFAKDIFDNERKPLKPQFIDYGKDILHTEIKPGISLLQVRNKENKLFRLYYVFEFGRFSSQKLPEAINLLQFLGTDKLTAEKLSREFYSLACKFNVYAGNDQMYVSLSGPEESFERALAAFENLLVNAVPDQQALNDMIANTLQEREDTKSNKYAIRSALGAYAGYGKKNPSSWVLSNKSLKKLKAEELTRMIHQLTSFPHTIVYYGTKDSIQLVSSLNKYHKTPATVLPAPESVKFIPVENKEKTVYFINYDMVQAEIGWTRNAGEYSPARQPEISMFNEYFGGGMSSVVFQTIRESKALAYSSYAYFSTPSQKDMPNMIGAYVGTQSDKLDSAIYAMNALLTSMPQSELLFSASKASIKSGIEAERIQKQAIVFSYLGMKRLGIDHDLRKDVYERMSTINLQDIQLFHDQYFKNQNFNLFILGSEKRISKKQLKKYGKVKSLTLKDIFGY